MKRKNSSILKKAMKISGLTCVTLGGAALIASGAAVKALGEGAKFLKDTVRKIMDEEPESATAGSEEAVGQAPQTPTDAASGEVESCDPV